MLPSDTSLGGPRKDFSETVLDMIQRASDTSSQVRQGGLEDLCRVYWKPIYHYLRVAWAKSSEDAKDLTQAFFLWLADPQALKRYVPERASFRTFLKALLRHFVQNHDEALDRLKRGGGRVILNLNNVETASLAGILPDPRAVDPDEAFETEWRLTLVARGVERVRERLSAHGKGVKFQVFEAYYLSTAPTRPTHATIAERLGLTPSEVHHGLLDVREEIRKEIRAEIARSASTPEELEEEWNAFFKS